MKRAQSAHKRTLFVTYLCQAICLGAVKHKTAHVQKACCKFTCLKRTGGHYLTHSTANSVCTVLHISYFTKSKVDLFDRNRALKGTPLQMFVSQKRLNCIVARCYKQLLTIKSKTRKSWSLEFGLCFPLPVAPVFFLIPPCHLFSTPPPFLFIYLFNLSSLLEVSLRRSL